MIRGGCKIHVKCSNMHINFKTIKYGAVRVFATYHRLRTTDSGHGAATWLFFCTLIRILTCNGPQV